MSQLDDLLARSRSPGRLVERRTFTLSRDKAIEKQREFALRHPRQYVLELVQAAVFGKATYIAIDTRPHSLLVAWVGGGKLTARELESLFDYLFADRGDPRVRHLVQLAIGVNAILQRRPRTLRIESGDGVEAVRIDLDARGQGTLGKPAEPIEGTYLYAEYGGGWFSRFATPSVTGEQALVEERCLYTPVPILLNGTAPFGYRSSSHIEIFGARHQEHFDENGRRGVVAIHSSPNAPTGFRMVVGGVWISSLPLEELATQPLVGVLCDDRLRKTADQSNIVQDHRFIELLHAVQPVATGLMVKARGRNYAPPELPPIPEVAESTADQVPRGPEAEPLPEAIQMLPPRGATHLPGLEDLGDIPVFYVEPRHQAALLGRTAEPDRFPWRVLVLTEGQVLTLQKALPGVSPHRLTSKADVDFVRRVVDRRVRLREHVVTGPGFRLVMRLHLEGPLPDWGHGRPGVPFCVVDDNGTVEFGSLHERQITISGARPLSWESSRTVRTPVSLPRVSLRLEVDREDRRLEERHVALAMARAWELAVPEGGEPHRELLAALLGALAVPQFVRAEDGVRVQASLPVGWPDSLRHVPLASTEDGDLSLHGFLALLGTTQTRTVSRLEELAALDAVEKRFGYGHLTHPRLEGQPLFGVGRVANRWMWLEERSMWSLDGITQIIWVGSTFSPRTQDAQWLPGDNAGPEGAQRFPELASVVRADVEPEDWEGGWRLLREKLLSVEAQRDWYRFAHGDLTPGRCEGMGRLALMHVTVLLGQLGQSVLTPSDGGATRSLTEIRTHTAARIVARNGVRLAEPWTFRLTRNELAVVEADGSRPALRYDDAPEVWRSLSEAEQGWLVRNEVRHAGLRGWLGLRCPHDGTSGILLRTTGQLIGLSEMDRSVPCHGLLWPDDWGSAISQEQRRVVQLAGLRLYQSLLPILRDQPDEVSFDAACRYATTFVLLAWQRTQRLTGTAAELARLVPVPSPDGHRWDTLDAWLQTPTERRPELPSGWALPADDALVTEDGVEQADLGLQQRVHKALGEPPFALLIQTEERSPNEPPVRIELERSHRGSVVLRANHRHPLVVRGLATPGRHREILLLEMARQVCAWAQPMGVDIDLPRAQLVLLGQRIDAA